jgi:hypothetical protein
MSNPDKVVDLIEERGPMSAAQLSEALGMTTKQVVNALANAALHGRAHRCGNAPKRSGPGASAGVYALGPSPGWLPRPLAANSIWQVAQRSAA